MPKISVIIGTLGRPELLRPTIERLVSQKFPSQNFEIIVVTNGGSEVRQVIQQIDKKAALSIRLVFCNFQWVAPKRNIGIRLAKHPIIAFIDDDCLAGKNWLETISNFFDSNPAVVGVEGKTEKKSTGLFEHATENIYGGLYPTCNLAFKRNLLLKLGGFDEAYTYHREDTDLAFKALQAGKIPFCKAMKVFHVTRPINWHSILKEVRWVRGDIRFFKKFPKQYWASFGFPAQGALKQGLLAWFLVLAGIFGSFYSLLFIPVAFLVFVSVKYSIILQKKSWKLSQAILFLAISFIRDILFIPAIIYYTLLFSLKEGNPENLGWNSASQQKVEVF